jgi:uncharacterized C2H2 Zn-finger protein
MKEGGGRWALECPLCGSEFPGWTEYVKHVEEAHPDKPSARLFPRYKKR